MKKTAAALVAAFGLLVAGNNAAEAREVYGMAGCGLGSMLFGDEPGFVQVLAATTNVFGFQTFAITSGTSNCTDTGGGTASAKAFVETNREALSKDIARGSGETIQSLSSLAGCSDPVRVGATLQKNFKVIFPSAQATDAQVSDSVVNVLRSDASLACGNIG